MNNSAEVTVTPTNLIY